MKDTLNDLPQWKLGYIAGILDGEGCITMLYASTIDQYSPSITMNNTDYSLVSALYLETQLGTIHIKTPKRVKGKKYKTLWSWHLGSVFDIYVLLSAVTKYMITKKPEAELLLEYCTNRLAGKRYDALYYSRIHSLESKKENSEV